MENFEEQVKLGFKNTFHNKEQLNKRLILMIAKSLKSDMKNKIIKIDYTRLEDEFKYAKYYMKVSEFEFDINVVMPIILANKNTERAIIEIEKFIIYYYTKINKEISFEQFILSLLYCICIHKILKDKKIDIEEIMILMKEFLIDYKYDMQLERVSKIKFEMERIKSIQMIDNITKSKEDDLNSDLYEFLRREYFQIKQKSENKVVNTIYGILGLEMSERERFIDSMSEYIWKIRNFQLQKKEYKEIGNPEKLKNLNKGDLFEDPLFSKIQVVDKVEKNNFLYLKINCKSGEYIFRFKK